ncbi:hypothetical protein SAY87_024944 [Trapa incisa]|uniref:Uncharacterized protein n=1 Tax=Trapa incisa TaxID=236973 RepID=A0AAN7GAF7_9MYRT|nr:hypothetical protein SAY87_024944 [Trapa incisa]
MVQNLSIFKEAGLIDHIKIDLSHVEMEVYNNKLIVMCVREMERVLMGLKIYLFIFLWRRCHMFTNGTCRFPQGKGDLLLHNNLSLVSGERARDVGAWWVDSGV